MQLEVEERHSSRFDRKARATSDGPPAGATGARVPGGLDWLEFSAAYFPGRRRHDLEALTAYSAYKHSRTPARNRPLSPLGPERGRGATAVRRWEDEGGATLSPDAP